MTKCESCLIKSLVHHGKMRELTQKISSYHDKRENCLNKSPVHHNRLWNCFTKSIVSPSSKILTMISLKPRFASYPRSNK
ncbi:hypothetical protein Lal_00013438 [Lupinus albus]|nr:hypothetical protein Lal_00013438 [Lupinus albus]